MAMAGPKPSVDAALLQRFDRPGPRYTSYPTAVEFHDGISEAAYEAALSDAAKHDDSLSLYAHLPFCEQRCLYCACNVVITQKREVAEPYLTRLEREIERVSRSLGDRHRVSQFHFGGGTPTYYAPEQLEQLMRTFRRHFTLEGDAEVAVEVDPRVTQPEHLEVLARQGFNRLSLGVQDFDPHVQESIHRVQTFEETRVLVERARALGFASINLDLIYGLPLQTALSFERTLDQVISLDPDRLAVYSFALVPWLKPHQKLLPQQAIPAGLEKFELLVTARDKLLAASYQDIGMDHFAKASDELAVAQREGRLSRNFMGYTTARARDMIGFGLSAIGFVSGTFVQNEKKLSRYNRALDEGRLPVERGYRLDRDDLIRQHVIREWMCNFIVDTGELADRFDVDFEAYFAQELPELRELEAEGFVELAGGAMRAGPLGRLFPRNVAMVFDRHLREKRTAKPAFSKTV